VNIPDRKVISTIRDQVYEVIKENILNEHFKPGQRIQELEIAKELNISRSPVRSAINELIGEGLLESIPNKSVRVRKLTRKEILDTYEFRLIIEKYSLEKIIEKHDRHTAKELEKFKKKFSQFDKKGALKYYVKVDSEFHDYLAAASGNDVILESLRRMNMLVMPFRIISLTSIQRYNDSIKEHTCMIDAILAGDFDAAWQWCRTHLTLAKEEIVRHLESIDSHK
jgi:DNA-binding GntR family transcriptional regulator